MSPLSLRAFVGARSKMRGVVSLAAAPANELIFYVHALFSRNPHLF